MTPPARETRTAARGRRTRSLVLGLVVPLLAAAAAARAEGGGDAVRAVSPAAPSGAGGPAPTRDGRWCSVGLLTGSLIPGSRLADYQWDTSPRPAWGAQALAGLGRIAAGVRVWSATTTQEIGAPGAPERTRVRSTSVELVGRGRLATWWGVDVLALGGAGRLHLGYRPDQVTIDAGGTPTTVAFDPIDTWIAGGGVAMHRRLTPRWSAGLELERRSFALDTAHRSGNEIVTSRETFGEWSARAELAWRYGRP